MEKECTGSLIFRTCQGCTVPEDSLLVLWVLQKQFSDAAADLSPGDVEGKGINKVIRVVIGVLILLCLQKKDSKK